MDAQNSNTIVCCMCGDIGFPDKLFRCTKCCHRFQHSYCSNYYDESTVLTSVAAAGLICDWCLSEDHKAKPATGGSSKNKYSSPSRKEIAAMRSNRSSDDQQYYSGEKIKQNDNKPEATSSSDKGNNGTAPSPKTAGRRYKLLKDVMC